MKKLIYEKETQTVRTVPENYCVASTASFSQGGHMDAAIEEREDLLQLFAAAPDMLEALELAANILMNAGQREDRSPNLQIITKAIRKARGES